MGFQRILIPLDGSALAESAITKALEMARDREVTLMLLRAAHARMLPAADSAAAQVLVVREAEEYLAGVAARLQGQVGVKDVQTSVWYGPPAAAIIEAARLRKADLIVMSTHGRSGLGRLILGSVAESVVRGTTTPILLLRAAEAPVESPPGPVGLASTSQASRV